MSGRTRELEDGESVFAIDVDDIINNSGRDVHAREVRRKGAL
jgi:hypothetical protein